MAVCPDVIPAVLATVYVATDPVPLVVVTGIEVMLAKGVTMTVVPVEHIRDVYIEAGATVLRQERAAW